MAKDATKAKLLQHIASAFVVHLATHGYVGPEYPRGVILLTPCAETLSSACCNKLQQCCESLSTDCTLNCESGLLTSGELARQSLAARLVVLSACQTGQGEILSEGSMGLSRSILQSGAPCGILSLWPVNDLATRDLMKELYTALMSGCATSAALRAAMLKMLAGDKWQGPVFWAAFFCFGCGSVRLT